MVRAEPDEERGLMVYLGAEFYPPALPEPDPRRACREEEEDEKQPIVEGQPSSSGTQSSAVKPKKVCTAPQELLRAGGNALTVLSRRRPRKKKTE